MIPSLEFVPEHRLDINVQNLKEYTCPLSPDLELCMMLEDPDCGLASWI